MFRLAGKRYNSERLYRIAVLPLSMHISAVPVSLGDFRRTLMVPCDLCAAPGPAGCLSLPSGQSTMSPTKAYPHEPILPEWSSELLSLSEPAAVLTGGLTVWGLNSTVKAVSQSTHRVSLH